MPFWNRKPKTRSTDDAAPAPVAIQIALGDTGTVGYTRLSDHPDVLIAVDKIADLVSSMTIHLVQNSDTGDKRVRNALSRKIDIEPCKNMTRKTWLYKIVRDLLLDGDGNSLLHIEVDPETGLIDSLTPFQMPAVIYNDGKKMMDYSIDYNGVTYQPDEVVHFVLNPHPYYPYRGTGYRVALRDIVKGLSQAQKTKQNFMSGKYMPTLILAVDALTEEMGTKEGRDKILQKYVDDTEGGKPWVIPADLLNVHQVTPLSLKDIAIIEGMEIDKKTIAGLIGVPAFFLGVGEFKKEEYNHFVNSRILSIGQRIAQTLTRDLLFSPDLYIRLNPRSLYAYDLSEMVEAGTQMIDRNTMRRNELRDWIGMDPDAEMEELIILENYIPSTMLGKQSKLKGGDTSE
ncbi:phage portal protein [Brevibacillus choshinensis]|uniref:Phage portal protein n=1 Tax=Brevibacillus choshinensis TaxID=54911 RepID=A0ABX7FMH1_BRECH|nr:phage portal protein [Brevibacillus choshinensis]QRG66938.1 phage portal protein [Brevibacillus choshinensis]